jgi:hypothetical protein
VEFVHQKILEKARVLSAPAASHPPQLYAHMFRVVFRNKFMWVCNRIDDEEVFECAYVWSSTQYKKTFPPSSKRLEPPLHLRTIRLYECAHRGATGHDWLALPSNEATLWLALNELETTVQVMKV